MEQLLRCGGNGQIIRADFNVCNRIHQNRDVFFRRDRLCGLDVHLHEAHIQLINALHCRDEERRAATDNPVSKLLDRDGAIRIPDLILSAQKAGDNKRCIRWSNLVPRHKFYEKDDEHCNNENRFPPLCNY